MAGTARRHVTGRPDSHVPARVLQRLTGLPERPGRQPLPLNWAMHYGFTNDQILENATGVGAPPATWPRQELAVDLLHKAVYAFTTGAVADTLAARGGPGPGQRHAAARPGRHTGFGPLPRGHAYGADGGK
ncbi:hypothetical protein ACWCPX_23890 [Streptomyces olivaceoviridis]